MGVETLIKAALGTLNPQADDQWTAEGLPRMDVIEKLVGDKSIVRKQVTDANPEFCREWLVEQIAQIKAEAEVSDAQENSDEPSKQEKEQQEKAQEINPEEAIRQDLLVVSEAIDVLISERSEMDKAIDKLRKQQRFLQEKAQQGHSPKADTMARMDFIKSQNEQRAKRYEKGRRIMEVVGKDGINPLSRLDQAMRRKTARGTRRPPPRTPKQ